jgi:hypothetical protein
VPMMRMLMQMEMDSILHLCVIVSALKKRRNVIAKRRRSKSTMSANMFNFLPSVITKDTSMIFGKGCCPSATICKAKYCTRGCTINTHIFKDRIIKGQLAPETVTLLCNDILDWDTTYSRDHFETCKDFDGPVDKECNCQIPVTKFNQVPLIRNFVDTFCVMFPYLTVDMVWLIVKSKPGSGFQKWHRDFYLDKKIVKTIVVNLGSMKRSEVPGAAFGELRESPPEINDETMKGEGKSAMKKPTKVKLGLTKRSESEVPGTAYGKLCKSPPETIIVETPTKVKPGLMKRSEVPGAAFCKLRKSPPESMIVDEKTELRTPQDNSDVADDNFFDPHKEVVDLLVDGLEHLSSGVQTFLTNLTPVNQELHVMPQILPPSLPPMFKGKLPLDKLVCDKCDAEQSVDKMRCGACKSLRGGKRGALKKSESNKKDKQHTVNRGRKPKQTQPAATVPVDCSNLFISSEDALSPLTAVHTVNDESIEESTIDWKSDSIDTVTHESNDERVKSLQAVDDINDIGDGGTSDGKGEGYDCDHSF